MVTSSLKKGGYEKDINPWRIENLISIYKSNFQLSWKLTLFMNNKSILIIYVVKYKL